MPAIVPVIFGRQFRQGVAVAVANVVLVGCIYAVTSYGIVPMTRWGLGQLVGQIETVFSLFFRALPLLILVLVLLLFTTEVWQTAAELYVVEDDARRRVLHGDGTVFVVVRIPRQIGELSEFESWERTKERARSTPIGSVVDALPNRPGHRRR